MLNLKKRLGILLAVILTLTLALGSGVAAAVEVPGGSTQVSIPVTLSASAPIAGAEVEFSISDGLAYAQFIPASGLENKIETTVSGKYYVGFFSSANTYVPQDGKITLGNLVFTYTGDAAESVTFSEIRLHTKNDSAVETQSVDSRVIRPNTKVNITRKTDSSAGTDSGSGSGSSSGTGSSATGSAGSTATTGTSGTAGVTVTLPEADATEETVIELDAEEIELGADTDLSGSASTDAASETEIGNTNTPLQSGAEEGAIPGWVWPLAAGILLLGIVFFLLFRRRKKEQDEAEAAA